MNLVDAFLLASAIAYYVFFCLPKPTMKNIGVLKEKVCGMLIPGTLLLSNLLFNIHLLWFPMGILWVVFATLDYFGYVQWNIQYKKEPSDAHQVTMFLWDFTIALACFTKF